MCINQCKVESLYIISLKLQTLQLQKNYKFTYYKNNQNMDKQDQENFQYEDDNSMENENYDYGNVYDENQVYEEYQDNQNQGYEQYENYSYDQYENQRANSNKKQYQVLPYNGVLQQLQKSINKAKQMTALPAGWCLILLRNFKWDVDLLPDYFQDMDKSRQKIGYKQSYPDPNIIEKDFGICQVCCMQSQCMLPNICGHSFCKDCWSFHLTSNIKSNLAFLTCMGGCGCPILHQTVQLILKICQPQDNKMIDKYLRNLCQMFSTIHKSYQFCTGVDCNNCIKILNFNVQTVRCTCGKSFCFRCMSDDHSPCSCQQKKKWVENIMKEEADAKWMSVNAKLCPWCKKAVERSAGCNYMACICGKSFCYLCSKPWQPDHKDHFKCHIYKKSAEQSVNRQKQILQKMNFYAQRYLDNQNSAVQNKAIDVFQKRKYLFKVLHIQLADTQFIQSAYKFSIQCCESLKWIYAYTYYLKFKNQFQKERFQFNQGEFQRYKVNLLKKLAVDMKKFIEKVQKVQKQNALTQPKIYELVQDFKVIKTSIVNYYTSTKSYKEKFIAQLESMSEQQGLIKKKSQGKRQTKKQEPMPSTIQTRSKAAKKQEKSMKGKIYQFITGKK